MSGPTAAEGRLGAGRWVDPLPWPADAIESTHVLNTADDATVTGVLRRVPGARTVVCLMHPRQDVTHHVLVPELLARGHDVWTQGSRSVNNDLALIHEQALLDVAAGICHLRERGYDRIVTLGHSGGGTLYAYYHQQAGRAAGDRMARGPTGRPTGFAEADMPVPDGAVFLAPHPGQAALLQRMIDPSVTDESDPLSRDPALDPYEPANGFRPPPEPTRFMPEFVATYRAAQRRRIERLDEVARSRLAETDAARTAYRTSQDPVDRRRALAPRLLTVYRTDADLRGVDLTLDPNERPYGSLFGRRPDLTNYGLVGFGRLATPEAWLSTWSAISSQADFLRCAPGVTAPTLYVELSGDQASFPADADAMTTALGSSDVRRARVRGTHFGGAIAEREPLGSTLAADVIGRWLRR